MHDPPPPGGKLLFQMLGVFAEFERSMIVERVKVGLKRARAEGRCWVGLALVLGRVQGARATPKGESMRKIARTRGIGNCAGQGITGAATA